MNKKLWTLLIAVLLIVTMSVCLFACSDNSSTEVLTGKKGSSFQTKEGTSSQVKTKGIQVSGNASFTVIASDVMSDSAVKAAVALEDQTGAAVAFRIVDLGGKQFRITPISQLQAGKWYELELLDSKLSFADYADATKLSMYVQAGAGSAEFGDNVTYLTGGSAFISNFAENGALKTFEFDAQAAGQTLKMGQIVLVENVETKEYTAYQVLGVEETDRAGIYTIAYAAPSYEEVYESLEASETAVLGQDGQVTIKEDEIEKTIATQLALAGFNIGVARFDINPTLDMENKEVKIDVTVTIPDMVGTKDGANSLDLILDFCIETKITVETDISLKQVLNARQDGIELVTTFDNTLTFGVRVEDNVALANTSELDAIIAKIAAMVKGTQEDDISIDIFNWVIPIGNGIADINFDVNLDMNFDFSGKIGVTSTSEAMLKTRIFFNPSTEEKSFSIIDKSFNFKSVNINVEADAAVYIGIDAAIKFELLGGVIAVGVGAEVGNFNKVYGAIESTNLLEKAHACCGIYFEGGIYYDAKFLYNVAKITSGSISFFGGRQEKVLYDAGSRYMITDMKDASMSVGLQDQDIVIQANYKDLVTGETITSWPQIIDATKIKEVREQIDGVNYVEIVDGKIRVTAEGLAEGFTDYAVYISADGIDAKILVTAMPTEGAKVGRGHQTTVGTNKKVVTAKYTDGTEVEVTYDKYYSDATIATPKAGIIILFVDGVEYKYINVTVD